MRYPATRPPLRRMMAIDQALRAGRWPNTKTFADEFEVDRRLAAQLDMFGHAIRRLALTSCVPVSVPTCIMSHCV